MSDFQGLCQFKRVYNPISLILNTPIYGPNEVDFPYIAYIHHGFVQVVFNVRGKGLLSMLLGIYHYNIIIIDHYS